jgi:hypothetical protein
MEKINERAKIVSTFPWRNEISKSVREGRPDKLYVSKGRKDLMSKC